MKLAGKILRRICPWPLDEEEERSSPGSGKARPNPPARKDRKCKSPRNRPRGFWKDINSIGTPLPMGQNSQSEPKDRKRRPW
jgi:hypothetical protein